MRGLKDIVVIVTGGGGGIGTATCKRFGEEGAKVAVWDIDAKAAKLTADEINQSGGIAEAFCCDITDTNYTFGVYEQNGQGYNLHSPILL